MVFNLFITTFFFSILCFLTRFVWNLHSYFAVDSFLRYHLHRQYIRTKPHIHIHSAVMPHTFRKPDPIRHGDIEIVHICMYMYWTHRWSLRKEHRIQKRVAKWKQNELQNARPSFQRASRQSNKFLFSFFSVKKRRYQLVTHLDAWMRYNIT